MRVGEAWLRKRRASAEPSRSHANLLTHQFSQLFATDSQKQYWGLQGRFSSKFKTTSIQRPSKFIIAVSDRICKEFAANVSFPDPHTLCSACRKVKRAHVQHVIFAVIPVLFCVASDIIIIYQVSRILRQLHSGFCIPQFGATHYGSSPVSFIPMLILVVFWQTYPACKFCSTCIVTLAVFLFSNKPTIFVLFSVVYTETATRFFFLLQSQNTKMQITCSSEVSRAPWNHNAHFTEQKHIAECVLLDTQFAHDLPSVWVRSTFITQICNYMRNLVKESLLIDAHFRQKGFPKLKYLKDPLAPHICCNIGYLRLDTSTWEVLKTEDHMTLGLERSDCWIKQMKFQMN